MYGTTDARHLKKDRAAQWSKPSAKILSPSLFALRVFDVSGLHGLNFLICVVGVSCFDYKAIRGQNGWCSSKRS